MNTLKTSVDNIQQYRRVKCSISRTSPTTLLTSPETTPQAVNVSCGGFKVFLDTMSFNGIYQLDLHDLEGCQRACVMDQQCRALDYHVLYTRCYIHRVGYMDTVKTGVRGIVQYRRLECQQ